MTQPAAVALAAVCLAVPAVIPSVDAAAAKTDTQIAHLAEALPIESGANINLMATQTELLNALALVIQVPLWIGTFNPSGLINTVTTVTGKTPVKAGTLTVKTSIPPLAAAIFSNPLLTTTTVDGNTTVASTTYTSLFTLLNQTIAVGSVAAVDLTTGQFATLQTDVQTAIKTLQASLKSFPASVQATLQYAIATVQTALGVSATAAAPAAANVSLAAAPAASDTVAASAVKVSTPKALAAGTTTTPASHGFLKQLQGAVDNEVGGSKVKVSTSGTSGAAAGSSGSSTANAPTHHAAKAAAAGAKSASSSAN
jgi:hypothetical protein